MAESMTRRDALEKAWAERKELPVPMNMLGTAAANWMGFERGFNAAWDVLLSKIRPLVADLKLASEYNANDSIGQQVSDRLKHADAVERLRELMREGGG